MLKLVRGGCLNGLRGKQLSLTLIAVFCTTLLIWAWNRTSHIATFLSQSERFEILPPVIYINKTTSNPGYPKLQTPLTNGNLNSSISEESVTAKEEQELGAAPKGSADQNSYEKGDGKRFVGSSTTEKKVCNYAKGKWVADVKRPLYSGFGCKQWLSAMWACRLTQRKDFSYEGYRWQPYNCEMPDFKGPAFLRRMRDKTLALVGDSLGRQQFQSLVCMVTGGRESMEVQDVGREYGLPKAHRSMKPNGWAFRFRSTNTTIIYYWSASLCELEPLNRSDPQTEYAMHLDRPVTFLRKYLHRFDILVLNTGHHWNRGKINGNRWVMHVGGAPNKDKKLARIGDAKSFTIYSIIRWVDSQLPHHPHLKAFFRTISPRHFMNGDWNSGGSCNNTTPLAGGSEVTQDGSADSVAEGAARGTKVQLLDVTALSRLRDECHISRHSVGKSSKVFNDCLHWCLPGVPDTWNELLYAQI